MNRKITLNKKLSSKGDNVYQIGISSKNIVEIDGKTVIKGIVILQSGYDKVGDYFTKSFIQSVVDDGNLQSKSVGCKSRFGHPNMCKTTLGTGIGRFKNFSMIFDEEDQKFKAIADLHFLETSKKVMLDGGGISLHDYIVNLAKEDSDFFGNSIVYSYRWKEVTEEVKSELPEGYELDYVQELDSLIASDIVDSPAATTNLFKNTDDLGLQLSEFMSSLSEEHETQLINTLESNPDIITNFIKRYKAKNLNKMSLLSKLKEAITGKKEDSSKDFTVTDANGMILTIVTDEERTDPQVGDKVQDAEGAPVEDGDHVMSDGSTITTVDSVITVIKPKEETTPSSEEEESESVKELKSFFDGKFKELSGQITNLSKTVKEDREENEKSMLFLAKNIKTDLQIPKEKKKDKSDDSDEPEDRIVTRKSSDKK